MADAGERQYLELPVHPSAASQARLHVRAMLALWRMDGLADTAELVVSELVTNAVKAGRDVGAAAGGDVLADAKADHATGHTPPRHARCHQTHPTHQPHPTHPTHQSHQGHQGRPGSRRRRCHRIGLDVYRSGALVVVEVWDPSRTPPTLKNASLDEEGGRGLMLVDVLAEKWGYRWPVPGGKVVWCALAADADLSWELAAAAGPGGEGDAEQRDREQEGEGALEADHELVDRDRRQA